MEVEAARYWLSWLEFGSKIAIVLVIVGVGYELVEKRFGDPLHKIIDDAREAQFEQLRKQTAEAQTELVKAQLELQRQVNIAKTKAGPRQLDLEQFAAELKDKPSGAADILYKRDDNEAFWFASQIKGALEREGWKVSQLMPMTENGASNPNFPKDAPPEIRYGIAGFTDIAIKAPLVNWKADDILRKALMWALLKARTSPIGGGAMIVDSDPALPENHFVILVGQKQ